MKSSNLAAAIALSFFLALICQAQDKTTGILKGKVHVEKGSPGGVTVILRHGDTEVTRTTTDKKGDFELSHVTPGNYAVTFRKSGLSMASIDSVEVVAGKTRSLGGNIVLGVDLGSIAFVRGSVFTPEGRSVPNVKVELARLRDDGSVQRVDSRITTESGEFVFRVPPDSQKYRVTLKADGVEPSSKEVEVDGPAIYRTALALRPIPR